MQFLIRIQFLREYVKLLAPGRYESIAHILFIRIEDEIGISLHQFLSLIPSPGSLYFASHHLVDIPREVLDTDAHIGFALLTKKSHFLDIDIFEILCPCGENPVHFLLAESILGRN